MEIQLKPRLNSVTLFVGCPIGISVSVKRRRGLGLLCSVVVDCACSRNSSLLLNASQSLVGLNALSVNEALNIEFLGTFCRSERGFTQLVFNRASFELAPPILNVREMALLPMVTEPSCWDTCTLPLPASAIAGTEKPRPATRDDAITAVANKRLLICTSLGVVGPPFDTESPLIHSTKSLWDYDLIKVTDPFYVPSTVCICR